MSTTSGPAIATHLALAIELPNTYTVAHGSTTRAGLTAAHDRL